jgi:peptidoglycan/LPS O-acetylase OafA/YrhL
VGQAKKPSAMTPRLAEWVESWQVHPSLHKNYGALDGLRGVAILLVVASHHLYTNPQAGLLVRSIGQFFGAGAFGVQLFFALSAFLISLPFWARKFRQDPRVVPAGYGWRRFWKIYPALALSVLVFTPLAFTVARDPSVFQVAGLWLTGYPFVFPVSDKLNPVMWTLVVEVQFYATLPLAFLLVRRITTRSAVWILLGAFLCVPTAVRLWHAAHGVHPGIHPVILVLYPSLLDAFAAGIAFAGWEAQGRVRKSWAAWGDVGLVLFGATMVASAWLAVCPVPSAPVREAVIDSSIKLASALLLCYVADPQHPRSRLLSHPVLRWFGIISYEWYLFHQPIYLVFRKWMGNAEGSLLHYSIVIICPALFSLMLSAVVYRFFSLPILRFGRGKVDSTRRAEASAS